MTAPVGDAGPLCRLEDLADPGSREFRVGGGDWPLRGLLVRIGDGVHAYVNRCPHAGHALNLRPDDFLTPDGALLICRSHGALFEPATGRCVAGPCVGAALQRIPVEVVAGSVRLVAGVGAEAR